MDELHASLIAELASGVMTVQVTMQLTLVARFYERLGDHAVNVAGRVGLPGRSIPERRPRGLLPKAGEGDCRARDIGTSRSLSGWPRLGQGAQFAGKVGGFGRPDPLEDFQCLLELVGCLGGVAGGKSAAAQASQRVGLIPEAADLAGQAQRLLVA